MSVLTHTQQRAAAQDFAERWHGRGFEKSDTQAFWLDLLSSVYGLEDLATTVFFETKTTQRGWIDVLIPDAKTLIEQKSLGVSLDKPDTRQGEQVTPFQQAKRYADSLRYSQRPRTIIVSDFATFRIHDLDSADAEHDFVEFSLADLPEKLHLLAFLSDPHALRARKERDISLAAGELIGKLYEGLRAQYLDPDAPAAQHSLNVLSVRLVFCMFAEDAGLFPKDAMYKYLMDLGPEHTRQGLKRLFAQLDCPPIARPV